MDAAFTHTFQLLRTITDSKELTKEYEAQMRIELKRIPEKLTRMILDIYQTIINIIECIDYEKMATKRIVPIDVDFAIVADSIVDKGELTKIEKAMIRNMLYKLKPVFNAMNVITSNPRAVIDKMQKIYGKDKYDLL